MTSSDSAGPVSRHLLIAGTGRAGTSFLVRYLDGLGLDTHLARAGGSDASWFDEANAGLGGSGPSRGGEPAVRVKSPWTYHVIDRLLADGRRRLDAAILPVP